MRILPIRCPRCHGNLALDQDRVCCLACGHEVLPLIVPRRRHDVGRKPARAKVGA